MSAVVSKLLQQRLAHQHLHQGRGIHGVEHWRRVEANGRMVGEALGADLVVISYFAWFHDARRLNDDFDPDHGLRGGELALELNPQFMKLSPRQLDQLYTACCGHTDERTHPDVTIACCWDGDRLDLVRLGFRIRPALMATPLGGTEAMITAATIRYRTWQPEAKRSG